MVNEIRVRMYHFSGNYDCDSCGRVNAPFAVVFTIAHDCNLSVFEHCAHCVWEQCPPDELEAYRWAASAVVSNFEVHQVEC